jgi:hypothetical protein
MSGTSILMRAKVENLGRHGVAAKFVSCLLSEDVKQNHFDVSTELVDPVNADENFLKNIVAGDETWVFCYDVDTKSPVFT